MEIVETVKNITVIGAGNGGKAMAAHLALMGQNVTIYNRTYNHIELIDKRGGIELEAPPGVIHGFGKLTRVTDDIRVALADAEVIMVVMPAFGHADIARLVAPYLQNDQIVILHPGRTGGALEFRRVLNKLHFDKKIVLAEAETFIYASRSEGPNQARIFRVKEAVPLAALPAVDTAKALSAINHVYPQFVDGVNVLHTGLNNMGAVFHPALTILNMGRIESTRGDFEFYVQGVTPSVAKVLEVVDRERVTIASALGIRARTAKEWLKLAYNVEGDTLFEAIQNQSGYYGIKAPKTLNHRYISEDVPMSLVPLTAFGGRYGAGSHARFSSQSNRWLRYSEQSPALSGRSRLIDRPPELQPPIRFPLRLYKRHIHLLSNPGLHRVYPPL
jgi:opine dehydrogenase